MSTIHTRMKHNYEEVSKYRLTRRTPVIIRLDGKAFHTFTKGLKRPYDEIFHTAMNETMLYLCENIQGCKIGYTQSDEITLLLTDFDTLTSDAWFDYEVQKMCSVSASMATLAFNQTFNKLVKNYTDSSLCWCEMSGEDKKYLMSLHSKTNKAMFDSRCFNIPVEEVVNCFIWRQQDATRNAIQMLGQAHFSAEELKGKKNDQIQDMLMTQKNINFNDMPTEFKRGVCCIRKDFYPEPKVGYEDCPIDATSVTKSWVIDTNIPVFTQDREYIEDVIPKI